MVRGRICLVLRSLLRSELEMKTYVLRCWLFSLCCYSCTFHGLRHVENEPAHPVPQPPEALSLTHVRLDGSSEETQALYSALTEVLQVFAAPEFREALREENLRAAHSDTPSRATSAAVDKYLTSGLPGSMTLIVRRQGFSGFLRLGSTQATACPDEQTVSISPARVAEWHHGRSGLLINTIAHELTHMDRSYVDKDREYCHEATLVSYRVGDLAQCFYEAHGDHVDFVRCARTITNGVPDRDSRLATCREGF